jgi:hypothetical protein
MNQFEAARLRAEKRAQKYAAREIPPPVGDPMPPLEPLPVGRIDVLDIGQQSIVPKGKASKNAYISVSISLPTGDIEFTLVKESVLANASVSRLTKDEFKRCITNGLIPLLGVVSELPRGG